MPVCGSKVVHVWQKGMAQSLSRVFSGCRETGRCHDTHCVIVVTPLMVAVSQCWIKLRPGVRDSAAGYADRSPEGTASRMMAPEAASGNEIIAEANPDAVQAIATAAWQRLLFSER